MGSLEFTAPLADAREELSKRLDPDMDDRVRSQIRHGASSLLTAFSESNDDRARVRVRVDYEPKALGFKLETEDEF
jgi:hypothetical protein